MSGLWTSPAFIPAQSQRYAGNECHNNERYENDPDCCGDHPACFLNSSDARKTKLFRETEYFSAMP